PWIVAGMLLVMMETLADFGTVAIFNFDTFTTAIYKTWFGLGSLPSAFRLAAWLMLFVIIVLAIESRSKQNRYTTMGKTTSQSRRQLSRGKALVCTLSLSVLFLLAFALPVLQLLLWFIEHKELALNARYIEFFLNTLMLASLGALVICTLAILVTALQRNFLHRRSQNAPQFFPRLLGRLMTIGYAIPGTVLAVSLFVPLVWVSKQLVANTPINRLLLTGSLFALMLGYTIRFFAVGFRPIDTQLQRLSPNFDEVSESLGVAGLSKWKKVILPLLRPGILTALALVFVDIMKEMPLTLMTRPFGWDTLAVQIFELTSEGEWTQAAIPSLAIVIAGLLPVYFLNRQRAKSEIY
ncbi:MAG: iron ABC transporter permease, partial [Gammaproteobacteria bacterium]|nr:iron ABC transporter permease [Gammaproteobacteria bacterium]